MLVDNMRALILKRTTWILEWKLSPVKCSSILSSIWLLTKEQNPNRGRKHCKAEVNFFLNAYQFTCFLQVLIKDIWSFIPLSHEKFKTCFDNFRIMWTITIFVLSNRDQGEIPWSFLISIILHFTASQN